jgi:hypothetical protein
LGIKNGLFRWQRFQSHPRGINPERREQTPPQCPEFCGGQTLRADLPELGIVLGWLLAPLLPIKSVSLGFFDVARNSRNGSARSHTRHEKIRSPICVLPNFGAGGFLMDAGIGRHCGTVATTHSDRD